MNASRAVAAGLVGTAAMTVLLLVEPSIGLPRIAIGQILSTALAFGPAYLSIGPGLGWTLDFLVGIGFALVYAAAFAHRLPGRPVARGMIYGVCVFLLAQIAFMPLVGGGFFSRGDIELLVGSLLGHLVYGAVVGWLYGLPRGTAPARA